MSNATLIDTTKCIGCRSCQVTCKQWNDMPAEKTQLNPAAGLQNPVTLSAKTLCVVTPHEVDDPERSRAGCSTPSRSGSACTATSRPVPRPAR